MAQKYSKPHLQWIKSAKEALKRGDHRVAAQHLQRVANYFWLVKDADKFKAFNRRAGESYLNAAKKLWDNDRLKAASLYRTAASCFREAGDEEAAKACDESVEAYYEALTYGNFADFHGEIHDLKRVGDYFNDRHAYEEAGKFYREAAERAVKAGKLALAGGLYRDTGDSYWHSRGPEKAAEAYEKAANSYLEAKGYFGAARHFILASLLLTLTGRLEEARTLARKAEAACQWGEIPILFSRLSLLCERLSERRVSEALELWAKIGKKFKGSYVSLIKACFEALTGGVPEDTIYE